jgi:ribosomal protein L9
MFFMHKKIRCIMRVYLLKNVQNVGLAGQILKVADGYALNYLFPHKFALEVTAQNEASFQRKVQVAVEQKEVVAVKTSALADRIKALELVIKRKMHDKDKLYAAVTAADIASALAQEGINVAKNQIELGKAIKTRGIHSVDIKLSSTLKPTCTIKVVAEQV